MSLKKITAGSGYDYLIRQVAAQDTTLAAPQVEGKMAPLT